MLNEYKKHEQERAGNESERGEENRGVGHEIGRSRGTVHD